MDAAPKIVTKIEANPLLSRNNRENTLLRVAAYCRVSTDSEDQLESYKAQVAYYTEAIAKNPHWRFVDIYADEGITGTLAKKRDNFLRMIRDCEKGKIDLILTKSVARFARNTVESLKYVRQLKAKGVGVYFEEQCIDSLKADSEMFIGIHSVLAQAESENISANVRWGIQQRMRSGTFAFRYNLLGYKKGEDGQPEIVEEEAEVVRNIFEMYLDGSSLDQIKSYLESNGILTKTGKSEWSKTIIQGMLSNERYTGDMLLQKTYTENCITKKVLKNRGEMAKYLVTNNHPAIIDRDTFKAVQKESARRSGKRKTSDKSLTEQGKYSGKYALTELLVCGECGSPYRRRTWVRNGVNRKVWRCLSRVDNGTTYCKDSISVEEEMLQQTICRALRRAVQYDREAYELILSNLSYGVTGIDDSLDIFAIESQIKELKGRIEENVELAMNTEGNPQKYYDVIKYMNSQILALNEQLSLAKEKLSSEEKIGLEIARIKECLTNMTIFDKYDDRTIRRLVDHIRVMGDKRLIIVLKGGLQIEEKLEWDS